MVLSTTFTQFAPETTKFRKITLNKGHIAVQGHSRSPILVPIESSYPSQHRKIDPPLAQCRQTRLAEQRFGYWANVGPITLGQRH